MYFKNLFLALFLFNTFSICAQSRIYFRQGDIKTVNIVRVSPDFLVYKNQNLSRLDSSSLLSISKIEFENGEVLELKTKQTINGLYSISYVPETTITQIEQIITKEKDENINPAEDIEPTSKRRRVVLGDETQSDGKKVYDRTEEEDVKKTNASARRRVYNTDSNRVSNTNRIRRRVQIDSPSSEGKRYYSQGTRELSSTEQAIKDAELYYDGYSLDILLSLLTSLIPVIGLIGPIVYNLIVGSKYPSDNSLRRSNSKYGNGNAQYDSAYKDEAKAIRRKKLWNTTLIYYAVYLVLVAVVLILFFL